MKSDSDLRLSVLDELQWRPSVNALRIGVTAKDGVVTLTGSVTRYAEKLEAERIARSVLGVTSVVNDLEVNLEGMRKLNDTEITNAALYTLRWHTWIPSDRITVTVQNGWLTLEGNVDWQYERAAAREAISHVDGVRGITNLISLTTKPQPADIARKIDAAFKRRAAIDARHVKVDARGNTIVLTGRVSSHTELTEAEGVAWSAPGVTKVDNRLTVGK